jgi:hypothetical protein
MYLPRSEPEVSDFLRIDLRHRLKQVAFVDREVEIQPRLGGQEGQRTDLIVSVTARAPSGLVRLVLEVKCSWNDEVAKALESQLVGDYLHGPEGRTGVYLVVEFAGEAWDEGDPRRKRSLAYDGKRTQVEAVLERAVEASRRQGFDVRLCFLRVELERRDPAFLQASSLGKATAFLAAESTDRRK